jgi:hypothetical protein
MSDIPAEVNRTSTGKVSRLLSVNARTKNMDEVLAKIQQHRWSLGTFLKDLFVDGKDGLYSSSTRTHMVSRFLGGRTGVEVEEIVEMIYKHKYSKPKKSRASQNHPARDVEQEDIRSKAQYRLQEWAIEKVEGIVDAEAVAMSGKDAGFQLDKTRATWEFLQSFSMRKFMNVAEVCGPTLLRILMAAGIAKERHSQAVQRLNARTHPQSEESDDESELARMMPTGSGNNQRNPLLVSHENPLVLTLS